MIDALAVQSSDASPVAVLLAEIAIILGLSRLMGMLFARFRQPQVVGEILAGILLGPSLLGWVAPSVYKTIFPPASVELLGMIAQIGVILFLFLVGLEFDPKILQKRGKSAAAISISGITVPFFIGFGAAYLIKHLFAPEHQGNFLPSALFMGAAMSVTAFPVLARIVTERNLQKTEEGGMAIAAAAIDDVLAWTMLAVVVAFVPGAGDERINPLVRLGLAAAYVAIMLLVVRPFMGRMEAMHKRQGEISAGILAILLFMVLGSALTTELIGVHALFGAFIAGFIMPKGSKFVREVTQRLETFTIVFLLPTFFAYAGLKADMRGILNPSVLGYTVLIIALACLGKIGAGMLAARLCGMGTRQSFTLGVLLNIRGLMGLIILTVGLQLDVINNTVYGIMIAMALVTTAMAAPVLELIMPTRRTGRRAEDKIFSILIPVARPESGGPLLELASYMAGKDAQQRRIVALHLTRSTENHLYRSFAADVLHPADLAELEPLLVEASERLIAVEPMSFFSRDIPSDIARVSRQQNIDLVLMGYHIPVFGRAMLGGSVHRVLTGADCDVAVFVDRNFRQPRRLLVPFMGSTHDHLSLKLAHRIAAATGALVTILHVTQNPVSVAGRPDLTKIFHEPGSNVEVQMKVVHDDSPADAVLAESSDADLVIVGVAEEWGLASSLMGLRAERIAAESPASMLIVRRYQTALHPKQAADGALVTS